jgi:hypothetical protein
LLLLGGVEANPGPAASVAAPTNALQLGVLNTHSAVHKAAVIHDVISSHHLDVMALTETWMKAPDPSAITHDVAPPGYVVHHRFRAVDDGGSVAFVCRQGIKLSAIDISANIASFESLTWKLVDHRRRVNLAATYRPPSSSSYGSATGQFCAELAAFPGRTDGSA